VNLNRRGILNGSGAWLPAASPLPAFVKPLGRLQGHRWAHLAVAGATYFGGQNRMSFVVGSRLASPNGGGLTRGMGWVRKAIDLTHQGVLAGLPPAEDNHLRFGELASANNMNYTADATFANVRCGGQLRLCGSPPDWADVQGILTTHFTAPSGPGTTGRYYKEGDPVNGRGALYSAAGLPGAPGRALRATWTEIPADLWFDGLSPSTPDGWLGDDLPGVADDFKPLNDRFGPGGLGSPDGKRDVRIRLEIWDDAAPGAPRVVYEDAGGANRVPAPLPGGRLSYKAVFVNDWDATTRFNHPLDVTPFLDDVTFTMAFPGGIQVLGWEESDG
jgi:hypothetical protein